MKKLTGILLMFFLFSCRQAPEPRFPVYRTYRKDYSASVYFNKKLFLTEQKLFDSIARADTAHRYRHNSMGMYYYFIRQNDTANYLPQKGDQVVMEYGLYYIEGDTIYLPEEIGIRTYTVDKEEYFAGLREAVKMMKEGEEAVFFVPSYLGYGLLGDAERIQGNTPLKLHLKIHKITPKKNTQ